MVGLPVHAAARHVPERSCVACRRRRPQGELLRLSRVDGVWAVQNTRRSGRGSYLCADTPACWAEKKLRRVFGAQAASLGTALLEQHSPEQHSSLLDQHSSVPEQHSHPEMTSSAFPAPRGPHRR